ncbi:MAG: hypothetical protein ACYDH9_27155 [Limisphaerales bacterium]
MEFVRRYCPPSAGWLVFVDIDASEEGRTGGERTKPEARRRQREMQSAADTEREQLEGLGVQVGGERKHWSLKHGLPLVKGDRDILAFHKEKRLCLIGGAEGESSGQPEQKLYKAIGQFVMAASGVELNGWQQALVLVVYGERISEHLRRATALTKLGIPAVALGKNRQLDQWLLPDALLPRLLSGELRVPAAAQATNEK